MAYYVASTETNVKLFRSSPGIEGSGFAAMKLKSFPSHAEAVQYAEMLSLYRHLYYYEDQYIGRLVKVEQPVWDEG